MGRVQELKAGCLRASAVAGQKVKVYFGSESGSAGWGSVGFACAERVDLRADPGLADDHATSAPQIIRTLRAHLLMSKKRCQFPEWNHLRPALWRKALEDKQDFDGRADEAARVRDTRGVCLCRKTQSGDEKAAWA
ncbi:hypothetical protein H920_12744 [Fukomys damarensis]|uniref:Uncharacterized protein n=1 Tax=Fukomys damarensis TaxID=885580 RepID=A0A091DSR3_FUKDA|nr:hypothetical protein H920_12744 [Fukomys damarensis]